jgi:hypothetical protein
VQRQHIECAVVCVRGGSLGCVTECDLLHRAAAFCGVLGARVVHENAPHHLRSHTEELRAVVPLGAALVDEPEIRLVDERRGLERVLLSLATHRAGRLTV